MVQMKMKGLSCIGTELLFNKVKLRLRPNGLKILRCMSQRHITNGTELLALLGIGKWDEVTST